MKLLFEREDVEIVLAREAARLLLGGEAYSNRISIEFGYGYGSTATASIKDDEPEPGELQPIVKLEAAE